MSPFMDKKECAAFLKTVKPRTLVMWAHAGKIPARKHGTEWVFPRTEIVEWSAARSNKPAEPSLSRFQAARSRIRSLKTQHTDAPILISVDRTG